jgi:hypothetical protein
MALTRRTRAFLVKTALVLPVTVFLLLAFAALRRGGLSPWHERCAQLYRQAAWHEMAALAGNLNAIGRPDPETLFWALLASTKLDERSETGRFADLLLRQRALNWRIESEAARLYQPPGRLDRLLMYRARAVLALLLLTAATQAASLLTRRDPLPWAGALAALGCLLLLA